jgi:hypothetical protein
VRKFLVIIIGLATLSFLAGVASAGTVQISGTHSSGEIKSTCEATGGGYTEMGSLYGCVKACGDDFCSVSCIGGKCLGTCPNCGELRLPVFNGRAGVGRIMTNKVERSSH